MYVALMNRSCCTPGLLQEGIYVTFNSDICNPAGWSAPNKILSGEQEWYPQILGTGAGETDKLGGQTARFYLAGASSYEIVFQSAVCALEEHHLHAPAERHCGRRLLAGTLGYRRCAAL